MVSTGQVEVEVAHRGCQAASSRKGSRLREKTWQKQQVPNIGTQWLRNCSHVFALFPARG